MTGSARCAVVAVKPGVSVTAVVKHAVEDEAHPLTLGIMAQTQQRVVAAKLRVNFTIIFGIVLMHAGRGKYRVQIQRGHPKRFQVR